MWEREYVGGSLNIGVNVSWAVVWAAWGSAGLVRRGLRGGRSVGGEYGNVEVVAIVEGDEGVT